MSTDSQSPRPARSATATGSGAVTTRVLLVRHGRTPTTGTELPGRAPGLHLSDAGRDQAERAAERLSALRLTALYASPLERARETAAPTARRTGLPLAEEPALLEGDFGEWTGARLTDLARLPAWDDVQHRPSAFRFPGGESFAEMQRRIVDGVAALRARHPSGTIVCFSHADPIRCLLADALGTELDRFQRISVAPGSISAIAWTSHGADDAGEPVVLTVNSTDGDLGDLVAS